MDGLQQQGWEYQLEASYVEVYNETLRDLLAAGNTKRDGAKLLDASAIKHDASGDSSALACARMSHFARRCKQLLMSTYLQKRLVS